MKLRRVRLPCVSVMVDIVFPSRKMSAKPDQAQCYEGVERTFSMIHPEAEQKRKDGDRPDRVEGLIESLIQVAMRSREHDIGL